MIRRRVRSATDDSGAILLMAIGFVVIVGVMSAGLAALATTSLDHRRSFESARDRQYAADGAIEQAISQVRLLTCASPAGSTIDTLNGVTIRVDWVSACGVVQGGARDATATAASADGTVVAQRNVIFSACVSTGAACDPAKVIIRGEVNFQQVPPAAVSKTTVQSWSVN